MPANVAVATDVGRTVKARRRRRPATAALLCAQLTAPRPRKVGRPAMGTCVAVPPRASRAEVVRRFPGHHVLERWHTLRASDRRPRRGGGGGPLPLPSSARPTLLLAPTIVNWP